MADTNAYFIDEPDSAKQKYGISGNAVCKRAINFTTGQAALLPGHMTGLTQILKGMDPSGDKAYIIGHASLQGHGTFDNNGLSKRRAKAVFDWFSTRIDTSSNKFEVVGEADTATIGTTANDPKDRAVVLIVQSAKIPRPRFLPPVEPHEIPDAAPLPWPWRKSGWKISSAYGVSLTVPFPFTKPVSVGFANLYLQLTQMSTGQTATFRLLCDVASLSKDLPNAKLAQLKKMIKELSPSGGPSFFPTLGSEIVVTSWVPDPVTPSAFCGYVAIISGNVTVAGGNGLAISKAPFIPGVPIAVPFVTAMGMFGSTGLALPGVSGDLSYGTISLV